MRLEPVKLRHGRALAILILAITVRSAFESTLVAQVKTEESTTIPVPREGSWVKNHESFLERASQGNIDLLFLGDSITQMWKNYAEVWDRYYGQRNAANFGIGGDRTQHVLWRLENGEIDGIRPKVVVLMIGTNNVRANTPEEIVDGIAAIVKTLRGKLPGSRVLLLAVFPRSRTPDATRERIKAVNEKIARFDDGKMVKFLDIGARFLEDDGTISREIMPDYLHLTRKGYRIWADAMEPTLWEMLEGK
jgi:lysophospholipase L1-like esterase